MIIDETFKFNLYVSRTLGLLHLIEPLLKCAYLIQAFDVDCKFFKACCHQPLNLLFSEVPDHKNDQGGPQQYHNNVSTHVIYLHEDCIETDPEIDTQHCPKGP
jgi:hypothetical protein